MPLVKIFASTPARITAVARAVAAVHPAWAELWNVEPHILQIIVSAHTNTSTHLEFRVASPAKVTTHNPSRTHSLTRTHTHTLCGGFICATLGRKGRCYLPRSSSDRRSRQEEKQQVIHLTQAGNLVCDCIQPRGSPNHTR